MNYSGYCHEQAILFWVQLPVVGIGHNDGSNARIQHHVFRYADASIRQAQGRGEVPGVVKYFVVMPDGKRSIEGFPRVIDAKPVDPIESICEPRL